MKRTKPKKPVVDLHLKLWDARLGSFIIDEAAKNARKMTGQIVFMLQQQMEATANGK